MCIWVIGGLGYVGSILTDILKKSKVFEEVNIIDFNIYDSFDDVEHIIDYDEIFMMELCKINIEKFKKDDIVILANNSNFESFYINFPKHVEENLTFVDELHKKGVKIINLSDYRVLANISIENGDMIKNLKKLETISDETIYVPCLYGCSPRMRWDTLPNLIAYNFILQKGVHLKDNWLDTIPIMSVKDFCIYVVESIKTFSTSSVLNYKKIVCHSKYSIIEIANIIRTVFDNYDKIEITTSKDFSKSINIEESNCSVGNGKETLIDAFEILIQQMEEGALPDFMKDKYNNCVVIENAISSRDFINKVRY